MTKPKILALSQRDQYLLSMPTLDSQLPALFENGEGVEHVTAYCPGCGGHVHSARIRGVVVRPLRSLIVIEALAACPVCKAASRVDYRIHEACSVSNLTRNGWVGPF